MGKKEGQTLFKLLRKSKDDRTKCEQQKNSYNHCKLWVLPRLRLRKGTAKEQQRDSEGTAKGQHRDSTGTQTRKKERRKEYIDTDVSIMQHSISAIIDAWNQLEPYGIKMIYRINPGSKRCTSLIALLEQFGEEKVIQAVDKVKQSDFLQGKTDTRFSLNFDWFINPNNFVKVLEGKYDERHDKKPATKNNNNFERRHYDMDDLESKLLGR